MKKTTLDLRGAGKVCKIQIDESNISGFRHEFPTLILQAHIDCPKPDIGKITLMEMNGSLQRKETGNFLTYFSSKLMFEVESYDLDKPFEIIIPLSFTQIERLEKYRQGNDLEIRVNMELSYYYFWIKHHPQRPIPNSIMSKTTSNFVDLRIPQSDWVKFLNDVGYNKIRILEMNFPEHVGIKKIDKLFSYLTKAKNYFFIGDYNKAIGECRRVAEDIPKLYKIPKALTKARFAEKAKYFISEYLVKKVDTRIAEYLKEATIELWRFSSKFLHNPEKPDEIPIVAKRPDAEYIINQTVDLAVYLSKII